MNYIFFLVVFLYFGLLIILTLVLALIFLELFQDFALGKVPFVPTNIKVIKKILDNLNDDFKPKCIYDLGAGDARFLIAISKKYPLAKIIGFEYSLWPYLYGRLKILLSGSKAKLEFKNFFKQKLSEADLIFCFLGDKEMNKLGIKFKKELKIGTIIISNTFSMEKWKPFKEIETNNKKTRWGKLSFYKII